MGLQRGAVAAAADHDGRSRTRMVDGPAPELADEMHALHRRFNDDCATILNSLV